MTLPGDEPNETEETDSLVDVIAQADLEPAAMAETLCGHALEILAGTRAGRMEFEAEVLDRWADAIDRLELVLALSSHMRNEHAGRHQRLLWSRVGPDGPDAPRVSTLDRLADRGALVAEEVLALLKAGLAAGAFVRWRTMHELTITAAFIADRSDDVARRFTAHESMRARSLRGSYSVWARQRGADQLGRVELDEYDQADRDLLTKYGPEFRGDYGWAHPELLRERRRYAEWHAAGRRPAGPTLLDLSLAAGLARDHVFHGLASRLVHGGDPAVVITDPDDPQGAPVSGRTTEGIHMVAPRTAEALVLTTAALVLTYPDPPDRRMRSAAQVGVRLVDAVDQACA